MTHYVLGFMFSKDRNYVGMIRKEKPAWQKGLLNGIGGKVEQDEPALNAMIREFKEETGVTAELWQHRMNLEARNGAFKMDVYRCFSDEVFNLRTMESEEIVVCTVDDVMRGVYPAMKNMAWVLPMVMDDEVYDGYIIY